MRRAEPRASRREPNPEFIEASLGRRLVGARSVAARDTLAGMSDQLREMARPSLFPDEGTLRLPGLDRPVTIRRDPFGVPRIDAETLDDLWFAQGVVTGGERLFQVELALRAATGRLAEIFGERTFEDDRFIRTIGLHRAAARHLQAWTEEDQHLHGRFREGLRAWIHAAPALPVRPRGAPRRDGRGTDGAGDAQDVYEASVSHGATAARYRDAGAPPPVHEERTVPRAAPRPPTATGRETRHDPILTHGTAGV